MKIKCSNPATTGLGAKDPETGILHRAVFNDGVATVDADAGAFLLARFPDVIEVVESKTTRKKSTTTEE